MSEAHTTPPQASSETTPATPPTAAQQTQKKRPPKKRSLSARGWIPDYHGAWAMVFVPITLGIVLGGWTPAQVPPVSLVGYWVFLFLCPYQVVCGAAELPLRHAGKSVHMHIGGPRYSHHLVGAETSPVGTVVCHLGHCDCCAY